MICKPCRKQDHSDCPGGNWCDCQHVTKGTNINPEFKSQKLSVSEVAIKNSAR